jgi:hypothetical protein
MLGYPINIGDTIITLEDVSFIGIVQHFLKPGTNNPYTGGDIDHKIDLRLLGTYFRMLRYKNEYIGQKTVRHCAVMKVSLDTFLNSPEFTQNLKTKFIKLTNSIHAGEKINLKKL